MALALVAAGIFGVVLLVNYLDIPVKSFANALLAKGKVAGTRIENHVDAGPRKFAAGPVGHPGVFTDLEADPQARAVHHQIAHRDLLATQGDLAPGVLGPGQLHSGAEADVEPVQPTSLFRTGSIAKSITSIAIHQLIEDGLLSYDTRVADALGLTPPPGRSADPWLDLVTVDHLLTHTVGWDKYDGGIDPMVFQDWWISLRLGVMPPPTRNEIATFMTGEPFQFYPGTRWAYCNFGYLLLQMLAE